MALFRRGIPRRAFAAAALGFLYGVLVMPTGGAPMFAAGAGWAILALSLLFARPISYYAYVTWALLWMAWRGVLAFQGQGGPPIAAIVDVGVPLVSIVLLSASGYLEHARAEPEPEPPAPTR